MSEAVQAGQAHRQEVKPIAYVAALEVDLGGEGSVRDGPGAAIPNGHV